LAIERGWLGGAVAAGLARTTGTASPMDQSTAGAGGVHYGLRERSCCWFATRQTTAPVDDPERNQQQAVLR